MTNVRLNWLPIKNPSEISQIYGEEPYVATCIFNFNKISLCKTGIWCSFIYFTSDLFKDIPSKSEHCYWNDSGSSDKVRLGFIAGHKIQF